ncbi:hypothetical protein [Pseudoalteromonas rubra]|uniref:hypothetical protein n=1 Tax=Pseudoalteromonas rubra TaxID=43658 RepID=UPI002DBB7C15|nr:hypothetical protein [Pseudoalteromonas rubra]MEC4087294.1 hypothetical protein [Pseudoalteromonas rubra]
MLKLLLIFLFLFISGCKTSGVHSPTEAPLFDKPGKLTPYNPFWEVHLPGTLLLETDNGYDVISDYKWLKKLDNLPEDISFNNMWDIEMPPEYDTGNGLVTGAESGKINSKFVANLNAKLSEKVTGNAKALFAQSASYSYVSATHVQPKGRSALSAFYELKSTPLYSKYEKKLRSRIGGRTGRLFIVNKIKFVPMGEYTVTFEDRITAEAKAVLTETLKLESDAEWEIQDNEFKRLANPLMGARGFAVQWDYREVSL